MYPMVLSAVVVVSLHGIRILMSQDALQIES